MKNRIYVIALLILLTLGGSAVPASASAKSTTKLECQVRMKEIKSRVEEIRLMDLSKLTVTERKDIKHELKDLKNEVRQMQPVLIISAGALVLIIILILILL